MSPFSGWENFYVIVGSSAGALIGLQFVVMTLIAEMPKVRMSVHLGKTFATPSVVHFGAVLLLSAILSAPWDGVDVVAVLWGIIGFIGIIYSIVVLKRLRSQTAYKPVLEDWLFHALLPLAAYVMLAVSSWIAYGYARQSLFVVAGSLLVLLFVGIHNAWDTTTYHVFVVRNEHRHDNEHREKSQESH